MADKPKEQIDTAPDPDEDDLDDLDGTQHTEKTLPYTFANELI